VAAALDPDAFWHQTPDSYAAIIGGVVQRAKHDNEMVVRSAHVVASLHALAAHGKLKPVSEYLPRDEDEAARADRAALVARFQALAAQGKMTFERIPRDGD
jgi:hypothetical protein